MPMTRRERARDKKMRKNRYKDREKRRQNNMSDRDKP